MFDSTCEEWRQVVGYAGVYEVSNEGRVRSLDRMTGSCFGRSRPVRGRILDGEITRAGYRRVKLSLDNIVDRRTVHSLVAEAFIGPRPEGLQVCHNDGDPLNNRSHNLRYDTASANVLDSVRHGTQAQARKTQCAQGHEFTPDNITWIKTASGRGRHCRTCRRLAERERRAAVKAMAG